MIKFFLLAMLIYTSGIGTAIVCRNYFSTITPNSLSIDYSKSKNRLPINVYYEILENNSIVYLACIAGFLTFGIYTALITFCNGFVLGYLLVTINRFFENQSILLYRLLPHTMEIIGYIIASTLGFYLAQALTKHFFMNTQPNIEFKKIGLLFTSGYLIIILSAYIETYVSAS